MAVFKCKMCGAELNIAPGATVAECEYCSTKQTLPRLDDERRANLYDRANHFRRNNEFDKAMGIYEQILNEDNTDAEAYWSLVLCRYGIEYVEDTATRKRLPTINRAQFTSIFDDDNYKSALKNADISQKILYETEAKAINEIQKGILAISQQEDPFDVFICYKESDNTGRRTPDSVLAQELYYQLTQEGFKVFFSRITLEDKLGSAYEPYIFAALNSAKVMVVLGTKPEFFKAVWVRNEWSRYLSLIKQGQKKLLIPAYKDMDPYDLPEEFSHLQAQDMSKLGFMQDLIRGIKKILEADTPKPTVIKETVVAAGNGNAAPLLKRAFMFLEDGDWNSANEYCEKVLDIDPENAQAYLGKLMAELRVKTQEALKNCPEPFDGRNNYQKAVRFADPQLKAALTGYVAYIKERNEKTRLENAYNHAANAMNGAATEAAYLEAAKLFEALRDYRDSAAMAQQCRASAQIARENAEIAKKDQILSDGKRLMNGTISDLKSAIAKFHSIAGWKDADECLETCHIKLQKKEEEQEIRRKDTILTEAKNLMRGSIPELNKAITKFQSIAGWRDADACVTTCRQKITQLEEELARQKAKDRTRSVLITLAAAAVVVALIAGIVGGIAYAVKWFTVLKPQQELNEYIAQYGQGSYDRFGRLKAGMTIRYGTYEQDGDASNGAEEIEWIILDMKDGKALVISKYALAAKPYHNKNTSVNWETCSLRAWMNGEFYNAAFSETDKAAVSETELSETVKDHVFALSYDEVKKYKGDGNYKICLPAPTIAENVQKIYGSDTCAWWLRSYGTGGPQVVSWDGSTVAFGWSEDKNDVGARPAMWIDLSKVS